MDIQNLKNQAKVKSFNKKNWIISQLRRVSIKYPPAIRARNRTKEVYYITSKKGKSLKRVKFTCELCGTANLKRTEMELDHIQPVVSLESYQLLLDQLSVSEDLLKVLKCSTREEFNELFKLMLFMARLYVQENEYQHICVPCHERKTLAEGQVRTKRRKKRKKNDGKK